jgi:hypothetical protein
MEKDKTIYLKKWTEVKYSELTEREKEIYNSGKSEGKNNAITTIQITLAVLAVIFMIIGWIETYKS